MRVELNENDISWVYDGKEIKVIGDYVDAAYDKKLDGVTALNASGISLFDKEGDLLFITRFSFKEPGSCIYCLANQSASAEKTVRVVLAHEPPFKGERFWQHDINIENGTISEPLAKWR
ncbi:hypothetical protein [Aeromonas caviae]|uniref:hypothetical protein n=1 Tax=Aeromonas caviae TaxID=648 RepID=UPI002B480305|nr:hypothetical protein [Aeromonas caviae]